MDTKQKIISHGRHIFNSPISREEKLQKRDSLFLMIDFAVKRGDLSEADAEVVKSEIAALFEPQKATSKPISTQPQKKAPKVMLYILLIVGVAICGVCTFFLLKQNNKIALINTSELKKEGRVLRFQGKLVDAKGAPIDHKVDVTFHLYSQKFDGKPIYTGECFGENGLVPGFDGSFQIAIGADCSMARIPDALFTKYQSLYMGIQVAGQPELSPRYAIANVQYASNTDKVKGLTLGTNESSIPYIDEEGRLVIGAVSPMLKSTKGEFSIEGQTVSIKTNPESSGSILFSPDAGGNVAVTSGNLGIGTSEPQYNLDVTGNAGFGQDIMLNGDTTSLYQNKGGAIRFYTAKEVTDLTSPALLLTGENKIGLATNQIVDTISAGGSVSPVENGKFNLGSATNKWKTIYTNELVMGDSGIAAFWQRKDGILAPAKTNDDIILGSATEQNALVKLSGKVGKPSWINSGLLGIGTSTPHQLLTAIGGSDNNSLTSITNLSKYDTNGTNVLKLSLGTVVKGSSSRFVDFYAGATSDTNGTRVGSIRLQNGGVVYQTGGADFAEYFDLDEPAQAGEIISVTDKGATKAHNSETIVGVVTDVAGFVGNDKSTNQYKNKTLVGLIGQVDTFVSTENGDIKTGDYITSSNIAGVGVKATESGTIVGTVLSSNTEIQQRLTHAQCQSNTPADVLCGRIKLLVAPHYITISKQKDLFKGQSEIPAGSTTIKVKNSNIKSDSIILITAISSTPVTISLAEQNACEDRGQGTCQPYFSVITDKIHSHGLRFNWLIVN